MTIDPRKNLIDQLPDELQVQICEEAYKSSGMLSELRGVSRRTRQLLLEVHARKTGILERDSEKIMERVAHRRKRQLALAEVSMREIKSELRSPDFISLFFEVLSLSVGLFLASATLEAIYKFIIIDKEVLSGLLFAFSLGAFMVFSGLDLAWAGGRRLYSRCCRTQKLLKMSSETSRQLAAVQNWKPLKIDLPKD